LIKIFIYSNFLLKKKF